VVSLFVLYVGCAQIALNDSDLHPQNQSTATNSEIIAQDEIVFTPVIVNAAIEMMVPYSKTSIWNTPIGPSPKIDPHSDEMIATIGFSDKGQITSDPAQYTFTVYFVDENTPRWDVPCMKYKCTVVSLGNTYKTEVLKDVPIPFDAKPSAGIDAQLIIIDRTTYAEYDFWQVERTETGWRVANGSVYNILWNGTPPRYGSRGAGVPYYAGLIRPWEISQGHIDHALAFGYPEVARNRCVFPATKTDGKSDFPYAIPEGARLQLDPTLTDVDFEMMGLSLTGKIIARALQEYGMFLIDVGGRPKIKAEDLENNPYATQQWSDPNLDLTSKTIAAIPYQYFRVLQLPPAYWNSNEISAFHRNCYKFSNEQR